MEGEASFSGVLDDAVVLARIGFENEMWNMYGGDLVDKFFD